MRMLKARHILLVLLVVFGGNELANAKDLGRQGATFGIKEEGFVAMIKRKLGNLDLNAKLAEMQEVVKKRVLEPKPVAGITKTQKPQSHTIDPSYVLDKDIYLPDGKLLYAKGTTVNPLDHIAYPSKLVFIDGSDQTQVAWAKKYHIRAGGTSKNIIDAETLAADSKLILVAGRPLELEVETGTNIYFDQFGELTTKFKIAHVPAVVVQEGRHLKVTEVYIEDIS